MGEYPKIPTVYVRDPATNYKTLIDGQFSLPVLKHLAYNEWIFYEKVDGMNIRICSDATGITVRGRTDRAQIPASLLEKLYDTCTYLNSIHPTVFSDKQIVLYGEGYGARIQKGGSNYRSDQGFALFDIKINDRWWLQQEDVLIFAEDHGLHTPPIIGRGTLFDMVNRVRRGFSSSWGDFTAEGIVARPPVDLFTRDGDRIITKVKCKDFSTTK